MIHTKIKGYTFTISEPYAAGTVITKGEAQALNDLRVENIANNLRNLVNKAIAVLGPGEMLSQGELEGLQVKFTEYDLKYKFQEKHTPRPRKGDIEEEARAVAQERVEVQLRREGREITEEELAGLIEANSTLPAVIEEARERVMARRRALSEGIEDI